MARSPNSAEQKDYIKGRVALDFEPRKGLTDFVNKKNSIHWLESLTGYNSLSENLVIKGDNLHAMAALRVSWLLTGNEKKFDVIYIDPPYNVGGNTGYKNKWKGQSEGNFGWARDHGKFLDFMEPRLRMAKLLMKDEGVIFVSICDEEYTRLFLLMEEIFGENNLIGTYIWDKKQGSPSGSINVLHEYVICFAKNKSKAWQFEQLKPGVNDILDKARELTKKHDYKEASKKLKQWLNKQVKGENIAKGLASYYLIHPVTKMVFASNPSCAQDDNGSRYKEPLKHPVTEKPCAVPSKGWKWKKDTVFSMVDYDNVVEFDKGYICGEFLFGADNKTVPRKVAYLEDMTKQIPPSIIRTKSSGVGDLPPGVAFPTPKPIDLIQSLIEFIPSKEIRILDFFAGSGTTAHAIINLNEKDQGSRTFVLIEEMESTINEAIVPRLDYLVGKDQFGLYSVFQKEANSVDLLKAFQRHAEEFVRDLHSLEVKSVKSSEGLKVVGYNSSKQTLVATLSQEFRTLDSKIYFRKELSCIAEAIIDSHASKVIIYRIETEHSFPEEPWAGIKSDIFVGTSCEKFHFVSLPSAIVRAWRDTLIALEAV